MRSIGSYVGMCFSLALFRTERQPILTLIYNCGAHCFFISHELDKHQFISPVHTNPRYYAVLSKSQLA